MSRERREAWREAGREGGEERGEWEAKSDEEREGGINKVAVSTNRGLDQKVGERILHSESQVHSTWAGTAGTHNLYPN